MAQRFISGESLEMEEAGKETLLSPPRYRGEQQSRASGKDDPHLITLEERELVKEI